jgi:homoserine/homoserine lactone efflux protein
VPSSPLLPQYLVIGATMVAVDLVVMGLYTGMAARLMRLLHNARRQAALSRAFSGLFAAAAVALSLMRRTASA